MTDVVRQVVFERRVVHISVKIVDYYRINDLPVDALDGSKRPYPEFGGVWVAPLPSRHRFYARVKARLTAGLFSAETRTSEPEPNDLDWRTSIKRAVQGP